MENFAVILIFLSLLGIPLALAGVIKGRIKFLRVKGRKPSFIVLIASFVLLLIGGASLPAENSQTAGTSTSTWEIVTVLSLGILIFIVSLLPVYFFVSFLIKRYKKSMNSPHMQALQMQREKKRQEIRRFEQFERIRIKNDRREWERRERKRAKKQTPPPTPVNYHHHHYDHDPYNNSSSNNDSGNDRS